MKSQQVKWDKDGNPVLPKALPAVVDLLYAAQQSRYVQQREVDRLAKIESACREKLIAEIDLREKQGESGKTARIEIEQVPVPVPEDWDKIWAYIVRNKAFEMVHQRLSTKAVEDRWSAKKTVPGVGRITVKKVHLYKLKGRG